MKQNSAIRALLLGGILPVVVFAVVEEWKGPRWGLVLAMVFGVGEIAFEWFRYRKVESITWIGNGMLLGMGAISILTEDGIWFKLQPAILELGMAGMLLGSHLMKKPLLVSMANRPGVAPNLPESVAPLYWQFIGKMNFRLGLFFIAHAVVAGWAAVYWSTGVWAAIKGSFTFVMMAYMILEVLLFRRGMKAKVGR